MADVDHRTAVDVLVIGAGPTGLSAADACVAAGLSVAVVERTDAVGGLARAASVAGNEVDLGGHRLLSATAEQRRVWTDLSDRLGGVPMCEIGRRSGILRDGYVVSYPFDWRQFRDSLPWRVRARGAASLVARKVTVSADPADQTLDQWVKDRYGPYLAEKFMAPHARKVFGMDPAQIPAAWAAQRILTPRVAAVLATAVPRLPVRRRSRDAGGVADRFLYPLGGVGVLWSRLAGSLGGRLSRASGRRDLLVGVVRVSHYPRGWHGYQWLYTHDAGVRAHRFNNFGEWRNLRCPPGVLGLEYTVPAGEPFDVQATAEQDMSILVGAGSFEFLGAEVARDAYANFDAAGGEFDLLDGALRYFGAGIVSTGRQGAGVYINLDQAIRLGTRVAELPDGHAGVVGRAEYSSYQERMR